MKSTRTDDEMDGRVSTLTSFLNEFFCEGYSFLHVEAVQVDLARFTVLLRSNSRRAALVTYVLQIQDRRAYQVIFYTESKNRVSAFHLRTTSFGQIQHLNKTSHTSKNPRTRFTMQPLHLSLMFLPLITQLFRPRPISSCKHLMTQLKRSCHGVAFFVSECA